MVDQQPRSSSPTRVADRDDSIHFPLSNRPFKVAGWLLGFGLGGFIDAIILHMVLQWHHLISGRVPMDTLPGLKTNLVADGLFSAGMWLITVAGLTVLWRTVQRRPIAPIRTSVFVGWLLMGWGSFHLFDSMFFHALLGLHHIRQVPDFWVYDIAFFGVGFLLIGAGILMTRDQANG